MKPAIVIDHISKTYGGKQPIVALDGIQLEIQQGELFGLIGPDGAGKTSLFRILTTLLLADKGSATVNGMDVVRDFRQIRDEIGYMPGKPFKERRAGKLSGGMKQKLALCCALIHKPSVLFLDEPTTGVDPVSRKEFWGMLRRLRTQNITIMVSTPYMDEASQCDRIALIQSGKILSVNTPRDIVQAYPQTLFAARANNNYHLLEHLKCQKNVQQVYISGEYIHVVFKDDDVRINFPSVEMRQIKPSIEDCFIQLMQHKENRPLRI
jgi:ABC-type multidrug transport system ATPase subunit